MFFITGKIFKICSRFPLTRTKFHYTRSILDIHPKVKRSLERGHPVVALESTIITHGMPHPQNYETAREVEDIVILNGAIPATIAIIDGRIKVGLTDEELANLAAKKQNEVIKCSRRDLPYVISKKQTGGTTVAATMIIAHMAGMHIFATGGIGGVHQDGQTTMDISADLMELGRTPVTVVCSGVKSILDIPRTLEFLETQGVCVATYGDANGRFPDFYTSDSGCRVPYNVENPKVAADLINALHEMCLKSGILIACPIPDKYAANKTEIRNAIDKAYIEAQEQGIMGKQVTPFLLSAIAKITQGNSLKSNIGLIKNNAAIAARISQELSRSKLSQQHSISTKIKHTPVVIGASILDISLTMIEDLPETLEGASFETDAKQSAGGVGRNLAEGIFKLHGNANFISAVGNDHFGKTLLNLMPHPLQKGVNVISEKATSLCSVLFDKLGECKLQLGNMEIHKSITPEHILKHENLISNSPIIIMDSNISVTTMECILDLAQKHQRPVFFEPTDMRICSKPFTLAREKIKQIKFLSPNIYELRSIVETITKEKVQVKINLNEDLDVTLNKVKELLAPICDDFDCVLVTLGPHGVLLSTCGDIDKPWFDAETGDYLPPNRGTNNNKRILRYYGAPKVNRVVNVSGAGDSFSSGYVTGLMRCYDLERCIALGFIAARRALQSDSAVPNIYFANEREQADTMQDFLKVLQKREL